MRAVLFSLGGRSAKLHCAKEKQAGAAACRAWKAWVYSKGGEKPLGESEQRVTIQFMLEGITALCGEWIEEGMSRCPEEARAPFQAGGNGHLD